MPTVINAINLLSSRLNSFRIVDVQDNKVTFSVGPHVYTYYGVTQCVLELCSDKYSTTPGSAWIEGVINGKQRNDVGELV